MIALIDDVRWQLLLERLDAVVATDAALAPARTLVKAPVALLAAIGEDVEAGLGDDRLALERVRALLAMSAVQPPLSSMRALISGSGGDASATSTPAIGRELCGPTLIDSGALVLAGLVASRAGAEVGLPDAFVDHVLALALAATPAEALSRAIASGLTDSQLRAALAALLPRESGDPRVSMAIVSFVADPCERARWRALDSLFGLIHKATRATIWEGATSDGIMAVKPRQACPGTPVDIRVRLEPHATTTTAPPHAAALLGEIASGGARIAFASLTGPTLGANASVVEQRTGVVTVVVPANARAGWVGVTSPQLVAATNDSREQLREFWRRQNSKHPALRQTPVPVDAIALLPPIPSPRRKAVASFDGGIPTIELFAIEPPLIESGGTASVRWRVLGADRVTIEPRPGHVAEAGVVRVDVPTAESALRVTLTAANNCGETSATRETRARVRIAELQVLLSGSTQPPHQGAPATVTARLSAVPNGVRAVLATADGEQPMQRDNDMVAAEVAASGVTPRFSGRVRVFVDRETPDDERSFGPVLVAPPVRRRVVIIRPAVLTPAFARVSESDAAGALVRAGRALGIELDAISAPWLEPAGFAIDGVPGGAGAAATRRLLERLNVLSAATAGLEDAVWVALVPGADRVAVARAADAAAGLAVASMSALDEALRKASSSAVEPAIERFCVFGTVHPTGEIRISDVRRRQQRVGAGAPIATGLSVVGVDDAGRDVTSVPLRLQSDTLPAPFVALLPMSPEMARIDIRVSESSPLIDLSRFRPDPAGAEQWLARRIDRVVGQPALSDVRISRGTLRWRYAHGRSVQPHLAIELGRAGGWWPIHRAGACASSIGLTLDRFAPPGDADVVRVVASDGWNTVASEPIAPGSVHAKTVLARYAGDRRFWVDFGDSVGAPRWRLGDVQREGPVITLPRGYAGPVELVVDTGRRVFTDTRIIDAKGKVDGARLA